MKLAFPVGGFLLVPFLCLVWQQNSFQQKSQQAPKESAASSERPQSRKNPVKPTPENLAEAKKFFGYDCAMCHGAAGDGKGDLAASMGLKMWLGSAVSDLRPLATLLASTTTTATASPPATNTIVTTA